MSVTKQGGRVLARADAADYFASLILYENRHLVLVYKPPGLPVQNDCSQDPSLLDYGKAYLIERHHKPGNAYLSLPHRLDRPVAGLCVLAKTTKAMQRLSRAFGQSRCRKFYLAVVENPPGQQSPSRAAKGAVSALWQEQTDYLRKEPRNNKAYIVAPSVAQAKRATLQYRLLVGDGKYRIIVVQLHTGRHHQIRCQLAALGLPIIGDLKYGSKRSSPHRGGIGLYAFALEVPLPVASPGPLPSTVANRTADRARSFAGTATNRDQKQVLQSVCLPWEWLPEADYVRQLLKQSPATLKELTNILE